MRAYLTNEQRNAVLKPEMLVLDTKLGTIVESTLNDLATESKSVLFLHREDRASANAAKLTMMKDGFVKEEFYLITDAHVVIAELKLQALKDNANIWFYGDGVMAGYFTSESAYRSSSFTPDKEGFIRAHNLNTMSDYAALCFEIQGAVGGETATVKLVGGEPVIAQGAIVEGSEIYGPCYIGPKAVVQQSVIYPGTFIYGETYIKDSEIKGSYVSASTIYQSTIHDCMIEGAELEKRDIANSILPLGTQIVQRKRK